MISELAVSIFAYVAAVHILRAKRELLRLPGGGVMISRRGVLRFILRGAAGGLIREKW